MSNIGIAANLFQPSGKCLKCRHWNPATKDFMGIQPQKISWEMEWADIVDLLTAKIPDQKGEIESNDFICGSWEYIL